MDLTDEEEERQEPQPHVAANIQAIAALIDKNGQVAKAEEAGEKARSRLGNLYQKIEKDYHGNIQAVKKVRALERGTIDAAYDFMRTFLPLARHFGLIPEEDLVDAAERASDQGEGEGVIDFGARRRRRGGGSAMDAAREHLGTGEKPPAGETPEQERQRVYGFDKNAPPGEPGDADLARGPDEAAPGAVAAE